MLKDVVFVRNATAATNSVVRCDPTASALGDVQNIW
jgi:hypothetical protein